jgi:hypothetical protein
MMDDGLGVVADERDLAAHRQDPVIAVTPPNAYCNASLTTGALAPEYHVPVLGSPSVMVAGPSGMQTTSMIREVEVGPGITLGFLSLDDYKFITSLFVIAEEHLERNRQGV